MAKKQKKLSNKKRKGKAIENSEEIDFSNFELASKRLITVLRLSLAKIKNDIKNGTLILKKRNENIIENKNLNKNDYGNTSTFPSLSFIRSVSENNYDMSEDSINKNEYELSDINKNDKISFDFDDYSNQNSIFYKNPLI